MLFSVLPLFTPPKFIHPPFFHQHIYLTLHSLIPYTFIHPIFLAIQFVKMYSMLSLFLLYKSFYSLILIIIRIMFISFLQGTCNWFIVSFRLGWVKSSRQSLVMLENMHCTHFYNHRNHRIKGVICAFVLYHT